MDGLAPGRVGEELQLNVVPSGELGRVRWHRRRFHVQAHVRQLDGGLEIGQRRADELLPVPRYTQTKLSVANQGSVGLSPQQKALIAQVVGAPTKTVVDGQARLDRSRTAVVLSLLPAVGKEVADEAGQDVVPRVVQNLALAPHQRQFAEGREVAKVAKALDTKALSNGENAIGCNP